MNQPNQQTAAPRRRAGILTSLQAGLSQPTPPRISIKAQRFTLVDGAGVQIPVQMFDQQYGLYLDVVIIGANGNKSKIYFENEYDPNKDDVPVCWSDNGIGPSSQSSKPQNPTCAGCPNNEWGSDVSKLSGKPTKLCQDKKKLAVAVVNDPAQLVYQLQVPPTTLKNMAVYAQALQTYSVPDEDGPQGSTRPCDPADITTRIYFNPKKQGELLFQPMGFWSQMAPYIGQLIERADASNVIDVITGANDTVWTGAIAGPAQHAPQIAYQPPPQMQAPPPQQPQFQQQAPQQQPHAYPAMQPLPNVAPQQPQMQAPQTAPEAGKRTRRGGARAGAGRPAQNGSPPPVQQMPPQGQPQQQMQAPPQGGPAPFQQAPTMQHGMQPAPPQGGPAPFQMQPAQPAPQQPPHGVAPQGQQFGQHTVMPDAPAFLQATPGAPQPGFAQVQTGYPPQHQAPPQQGGAYGMQNGAAPPADLGAAIEHAFGAPMQPRQR